MSASPDILNNLEIELQVKDRLFVIPMKPRKVVTSIKVMPEALAILDKFAVLNGGPTRSRMIAKLVEYVANGVRSAQFRVKLIAVVVVDKNDSLHIGGVMAFNPSKHELEDLRYRIYRALLG